MDEKSKSIGYLAMSSMAVAFCAFVSLLPVGGWTLALMTVVSLVGIAGVLHMSGWDKDERK